MKYKYNTKEEELEIKSKFAQNEIIVEYLSDQTKKEKYIITEIFDHENWLDKHVRKKVNQLLKETDHYMISDINDFLDSNEKIAIKKYRQDLLAFEETLSEISLPCPLVFPKLIFVGNLKKLNRAP